MARAGDVFPPNNLPGSSANWGRQVVRRIELGERSELQLSQKVDNGLRANAGQLAVLADQMNDIIEQQNFLANQFTFQSLNYDSRWEFEQTPAVADLVIT